jgi:hypothetical protein
MFLTIDHISEDGAEHRRQNNISMGHSQGGAIPMCRWLKRHGYPPGFQVLCFNCNSGKHLNGGVCPHEEDRAAALAGMGCER